VPAKQKETVAEFAARCLSKLREHDFDVTAEVEALKVFIEAGEVADAVTRLSGQSRRPGTLEEAGHELADVVITAYILAQVVEVNLDARLAQAATATAGTTTEQLLWLAGEAGKVVAAYLEYARWHDPAGQSTRYLDNLADRLANVVVLAKGLATLLGIDFDAAWRAKGGIIMERPWKEGAAPASPAAVAAAEGVLMAGGDVTAMLEAAGEKR